MTQLPKGRQKLVLVLPEAFNCAGGIQMFCRSLCLAAGRWAKSNGGSVSAVVLNDSGAPDPRYVNGRFESFATAKKSKVKLLGHYLKQIVADCPEWVIFGHVSLSPLALVSKVIRPSVKVAIVAHGIEVWRPLSWAERRALKSAQLVLAVSEYTRLQVATNGQIDLDKIRIFPCALDPHWTTDTNRIASNAQMLLTVARLNTDDRYKAIDNVIRSLPEVARAVGPIEYRIVGAGNDVPRLKTLAEELGVSHIVNFVGLASEEDLRRHYQDCSLFVMPSNEEGFGIVFLEAMAFGKAVIGGANGGTPSVVKDGETGLLVESTDVSAIGKAITRLLQDEQLRTTFGEAGHQRLMKEFTFERFEQNLQDVLQLN